jgi:L,D-transpeptidase ErfK/SrfK
MLRHVRFGLVTVVAIALLAVGHDARAGQWSEEDFAHRIPRDYAFVPPGDGERTVVGGLATYVVQPGDTMLDVGRHFDLGYNDMMAANPGVDPWLPPSGEVLLIPTEFVLPDSSYDGIVVNIPEMRLYYFHGGGRHGEGRVVTTYPVGLGRDDWRTPQGSFRVRGKTENPTWVIPESIRAEHIKERGDDRTMIPGGVPENPLGSYRLELTLPLYALHGTNMPWGVGMQVSHGCIRLYNEDITLLFHTVRVGTPGEFVYQPVKAGMRDGIIYVEVHPDIYALRTSLEDEAERVLGRHGWSDRVDRARLRQALSEQSGVPVAISRDATLETAAASR